MSENDFSDASLLTLNVRFKESLEMAQNDEEGGDEDEDEDEFDFDIVVLPHSLLTNPPLSSLDDRPFKRASIDALGRILDGPDPAGTLADHG